MSGWEHVCQVGSMCARLGACVKLSQTRKGRRAGAVGWVGGSVRVGAVGGSGQWGGWECEKGRGSGVGRSVRVGAVGWVGV